METSEVMLFLLGQALTAGGIYAAIRADLREALVRVDLLERWRDRLEAKA